MTISIELQVVEAPNPFIEHQCHGKLALAFDGRRESIKRSTDVETAFWTLFSAIPKTDVSRQKWILALKSSHLWDDFMRDVEIFYEEYEDGRSPEDWADEWYDHIEGFFNDNFTNGEIEVLLCEEEAILDCLKDGGAIAPIYNEGSVYGFRWMSSIDIKESNWNHVYAQYVMESDAADYKAWLEGRVYSVQVVSDNPKKDFQAVVECDDGLGDSIYPVYGKETVDWDFVEYYFGHLTSKQKLRKAFDNI